MDKIQLFEDKKIRSVWDANKEEWFLSVVDVCAALAETTAVDKSAYWRKMKQRLKAEGSEVVTFCHDLKMLAADGKYYKTDAMLVKNILRVIQSIPSKKAEPFKMWIAKIASERLDEIADPEKAIIRGADYYRAKGYSESWINQRLQTIEIRKELTDEWKVKGIDREKDYAILTNEMTVAWSDMNIKQYKQLKGLTKQNLRDNMTNIELTLNQLAEVTTTLLSKELNPKTFNDSCKVAKAGGSIARNTRNDIEQRIGKSVISSINAKTKHLLEINMNDEEKSSKM